MIVSTFLGRFGSNEDDLRRYEERIATLKEQLSQEKERNEELKTKIGDGSRAGQEELRATQTEKARLQREVRQRWCIIMAAVLVTDHFPSCTEQHRRTGHCMLSASSAVLFL